MTTALIGPTAVTSVDPGRLAALLGHGVDARLAGRMIATHRLRLRLEALLTRRLGPLPSLSVAQARFLGLAPSGLATLAREAGAIWHAESMAALFEGPAVRALVEAIGADLRTLALRARELSGPALALSPDAIAAALPAAGGSCLLAWCEAQATAMVPWLTLRLPVQPLPTDGLPAARVSVVAWLLER